MVKKRHLLSEMQFDEVSLVDRGANQLADVLISKRAEPGDLAKHSPDTGDVHAEETLPEKKRRKKNRGPATDDIEKMTSGVGFSSGNTNAGSLDQDRPGVHGMGVNLDDLPSEVVEYIEKAEAYIDTLEAQVSKGDDAEATSEDGEVSEADTILKSIEDPAQRTAVAAILKRAEEAETLAKAERDLRLSREFIEKARDSFRHLPMPADELGPVLKNLSEKAPEEYESVKDLLAKVDASLSSANVFAEVGKSGGSETTVSGRLETLAKSLQSEDPNLTSEAAVAKALADNPDLYDEYLREGSL